MAPAEFLTPLLVLAACSPAARPRIAEVHYDALGDDTGHEFVELYNASSLPCPLAGLRLEAGDGAGPDRWTLRWLGASGDSIAAGARFVIGGASVVPLPDVVAILELQNGPDAVRLVWPDGESEVVGYGPLAWAGYFCGAPAPDVPSGLSLARTPDDSDRGSNALDFVPATPSPGAANRPGRDAAPWPESLAPVPEQPATDTPFLLAGAVANRGAEPIAEHEVVVEVAEVESGIERPLASGAIARPISPGDTVRFAVAVPALAAGKRTLRARARLAGDEAPDNDTDSVLVRIGPGPLEVTEIQFHPAAGEGEWVEVRNRTGAVLSLASFTLGDRRGAPGTPAGGSAPLDADSLAVLAQDRMALLARFPALDAPRIWEVRPWGSLNNTDDSTGVADVVTLRESDGTPCERVPYTAAGIAAGVPIERRPDGSWAAAIDPLGGPLAPPRALPPLATRFAVTPRRLRADATSSARLGWDLPWPRGRIAVELYDLSGRRIAQVLPETAVSARGERSWSAAGLSPGLYLMALRARGEEGGGTLTATQPVRVEGGAP